MNPQEVRDLGGHLQRVAGDIERLMGEVNTKVGSTTWVGPDATQFKDQWWPEHRQHLQRVATDLNGFGQAALNNAAEQEQTSGR
jgi:hypothetical protein